MEYMLNNTTIQEAYYGGSPSDVDLETKDITQDVGVIGASGWEGSSATFGGGWTLYEMVYTNQHYRIQIWEIYTTI